MFQNFPLWPDTASTVASEVDGLFLLLIAIAAFFVALIFLLVTVFAIRYRRRSEDEIPEQNLGSLKLEVVWSVIPLFIAMGIFAWSTKVYFDIVRPPANAMEIYAVGKQWMWKFQHPEGNREINELHLPLGRAIRVTMTSEDVIHSLYVPAFRVKQDVLPGRYTSLWFQPTKVGTYHLFCAEYCGTQHSGMGGSVVVMAPADYESWLSGDTSNVSMADRGEKLFNQLGCVTCHVAEGSGRCPSLVGVFGKPVNLVTGEQQIADEAYVRESILRPNAKLVSAYQPIMPTYQGQVSEEGILQLIAYVKSLAPQAGQGQTSGQTTGQSPAGAQTPGTSGTTPGTAAGSTVPTRSH